MRVLTGGVVALHFPGAGVAEDRLGALDVEGEVRPHILVNAVDDARGAHAGGIELVRSEERRVGKECVRTCRSRWSPIPEKKNNVMSTESFTNSSTTREAMAGSSEHH